MALHRPTPESPSHRSKLTYAGLALLVIAGTIETCRENTHDRVMAATDFPSAPPAPKSRPSRITRVALSPEPEDSGHDSRDSESSFAERTLSYMDPNLEVFMRLQECAPQQDWSCTLQLSRVEPFWVYPKYTQPAFGSPFELRTQSHRPIVCTLEDFADFTTYIAVDPWSTQVDISNDSSPSAYFGPTPFLQGPADPCDALSMYRDRLEDTADLHLSISEDLLVELGFDEAGEEDDSHCFTQSFYYPGEPLPLDTADTGAALEEPTEDEETIRICLSDYALGFTSDFSWNDGPWEDSFHTPVSHPEQFVATIGKELDFLLNEEGDTAEE